MPMNTMSGEDFAHNLAAAQRAAMNGPVIINDNGRPAYAFMTIDNYRRLAGQSQSTLLEVMDSIPGGDFEFEAPRLEIRSQAIDLD